MSEMLMDIISLPQNSTGGGSSFSLHVLLGHMEREYVPNSQGSYILDHGITGSSNSVDLDWVSLVKHYMKESDEILKMHSGLNSWVTIMTPSPGLDQSKTKIIIDGLALFNKGLIKKRAKLIQKYQSEKIKYFHYLKDVGLEESIDKIFKNVADIIIQLPYDAIAAEITPDKSIFLEMRTRENILHFKLILANPLEPMAFFAIYKNSSCIDNGVGPVNDILNHLLAIKHEVSARTVTKE